MVGSFVNYYLFIGTLVNGLIKMENYAKTAKAMLQKFVDDFVATKENIMVLDAGCGANNCLVFDSKRIHLIGIDISKEQLRINSIVNTKVLGDIQCCNFKPSIFDIILCWDVLEHLEKPLLALENLLIALKKNGLLILVLPNILSLKGLITKFTPYRFHIWYYKHILKMDVSPFKKYFKLSLNPYSLKKFAKKNGLLINYFESYDNFLKFQKFKIFFYLFLIAKYLIKIITLKVIDRSQLVIVLKK